MTQAREILRLRSMGLSQREIAASCRCSRNTVADVLTRAQAVGIAWPIPEAIDGSKLLELLYPDKQKPPTRRKPNYEYIHKELGKTGVTLTLLWHEYCEECSRTNETPLMYSQFTELYRRYAQKTKAVMHINHKPGDTLEVDWAGQLAKVVDRDTGEILDAHLFVATLSCSKYTYVEAFPNETQESWISGHVNAFGFFGGIPRILTPDNLKTGVEKTSNFDPTINKAYQEMAEYYNVAVVPARVRRPKDKPNAESSIGDITTWIIAALRNRTFFSFTELNAAIREKLDKYNNRPFQKIPGSRRSAFLAEEHYALQPLPATPYEFASWKIATVQFNYHISVENMHYSVPYEYIKQKVDVRISRNVIEVFLKNRRICSHPRLYGRPNQYSTLPEHMPPEHKQYLEWNSDRFLNWACKIGNNTLEVIRCILASRKVEQQAYKACFGILKLADRYSASRLENACKRALQLTPSPSFKNIDSILKTGQDKTVVESSNMVALPKHENIRGAGYYRGGN